MTSGKKQKKIVPTILQSSVALVLSIRLLYSQVQSHSFYIPCGLYGSILEIVLTNSVAQPSQSVNMTERRDPGTQAMSINNI
jgi:hypothetical protein